MKLRYVGNVSTLSLNREQCSGCGLCVQVCPHSVFTIDSGRLLSEGGARRIVAIADRDACMECGACVRNCPTGALSVHPGVGCAAAILTGWLKGTEPSCGSGCGTEQDASCCGETGKGTGCC